MSSTRSHASPASPHRLGNLAVVAVLVGLAILAGYAQTTAIGWPDPGARRWLAAGVAGCLYVLACTWMFALRRKAAQLALAATARGKIDAPGKDILVAYASQSGSTAQLAEKTTESLRAGGMHVELCSLQELDLQRLQRCRRALFLVSTTGEGDAPDMAAGFVDSVMRSPLALDHLGYAVLALGDSEYVNYCSFGHAVEQWLQRSGAKRLFDMIDVDDGDDGALRHWQYRLGQLSGCSDLPDWQEPRYARWLLSERRLVNPGSLGDPCFHLALQPLDAADLAWQAGDIVEIGPENAAASVEAWLARHRLDGDAMVKLRRKPLTLRELASRSSLVIDVAGKDAQQIADALVPLPHRDYSIASIPADGKLELLLRQWRRADGSLGLGTGWLTEYAPLGAEVRARVRANATFHAPDADVPVILIGNGTGIASLRAMLRQRIAEGRFRNWLIFGERNADRDFHYAEEIVGWKDSGRIERLDLAFSRDQPERIHVQHRLQAAAADLRRWLADGAIIHVCGSSQGMAPGVDATLRHILGDEGVHALTASARYRRDVY
ncbi:MAG: flavodoxin domain-containing protein [Xanthomonadales bacterium]|nr:flavodoxin domain-containing protein [Xanthomonadales bacterium]